MAMHYNLQETERIYIYILTGIQSFFYHSWCYQMKYTEKPLELS